jgi:MarR family transcriptional regulator, 2-MHQ and catechol-resistance regulon repressor
VVERREFVRPASTGGVSRRDSTDITMTELENRHCDGRRPQAEDVVADPLLDGRQGGYYLEFEMNSKRRIVDDEFDEDTKASLKLWLVMARASRAIAERTRKSMESSGLSPSEFGVLEALYHKGPLTIGEIGGRLLMASGSMTYVVDKLESRGLLARRVSADDRRAILVELTPQGDSWISDIFPRHAEEIRQATDGLTVEEKHITAALLRRLGKYAQDLE